LFLYSLDFGQSKGLLGRKATGRWKHPVGGGPELAFLPFGKPNNAINFRSMPLFFSVKIAFNNLYLIYKKSLVRYTSKNNL
jgi:hypothetical protein